MKLLPALLCLFFSAVIPLSAQVELVDNRSNPFSQRETLNASGTAFAQALATGSSLRALHSISVDLFRTNSSAFTVSVKLWTGDGNAPESIVEDLGTRVITAGAASTDVSATFLSVEKPDIVPNTRYWISVSNLSGEFAWNQTGTESNPLGDGVFTDLSRGSANDGLSWPTPGTSGQYFRSALFGIPLIRVTNAANSGIGSLRQAIIDAQSGHLIRFAPNLSGDTILLTSGQLTISKDLTFDASALASGIVISGDADGSGTPTAGDSRIFTISAPNTVVMDRVIVTGGSTNTNVDGGGILNNGSLTLRNSTLIGNQTGERGEGGGIYNVGTLVLESSTIAVNRSGNATGANIPGVGGGIFNSGSLTIRNSTISGNKSGDSPQVEGAAGGGIHNSGTLVIENSTISNNRAGDGGSNGFNDFGGSGGGIFTSNGATIRHCLIAGNFVGLGTDGFLPGSGPDLAKGGGAISVTGVNLIGINETVEGEFPAPFPAGQANVFGDFAGTASAPLDPLLEELNTNGGPSPTHLPMSGSFAINPAGGDTSSALATDQRGFPRISGAILDIGSVEVPPLVPVSRPVITTAKSVTAKKGRALLRGTSRNASLIQFRVAGDGGFKTASGTVVKWKVTLRKLKKTRNRVTIRASAEGSVPTTKNVIVKNPR
jgi:hypothetical protein